MNRGFAFKAIVRVLLVLLVFYLGLCSYAKWQAYRARKDAEAVSNLRPNLFLKQVLVMSMFSWPLNTSGMPPGPNRTAI